VRSSSQGPTLSQSTRGKRVLETFLIHTPTWHSCLITPLFHSYQRPSSAIHITYVYSMLPCHYSSANLICLLSFTLILHVHSLCFQMRHHASSLFSRSAKNTLVSYTSWAFLSSLLPFHMCYIGILPISGRTHTSQSCQSHSLCNYQPYLLRFNSLRSKQRSAGMLPLSGVSTVVYTVITSPSSVATVALSLRSVHC